LLIFLFVLDNNQVAIASKGGIELILQAMKLHPNHADVQEQGCGALLNLAVNSELKILFFVVVFSPFSFIFLADEFVFLFFC
jgi:hypothetical protein